MFATHAHFVVSAISLEFDTIARGNCGASVNGTCKQVGPASIGMIVSAWICLNFVLLTLNKQNNDLAKSSFSIKY